MVAPWAETPAKVVIEFKKGSDGMKRKITLTHQSNALPQQLYGRVAPEVWAGFMADCERLCEQHPYVASPTASCCAMNVASFFLCICIGFGCFQGDGGDYNIWLQQVEQVLSRHRPAFAHGGAALSVQSVHGGFWIQIDINMAVAVGQPAMVPPPGQYAPPPGAYPSAPPGPYPQMPPGQPYPPPAGKTA
mmetsp:Transcript_34154/g.75756  ORF Transcript_34154/g.75756 Transcript_34154/m.75756 type:complete len:190 (-) Transcript_34154:1259-1828(-)